MQTAVLLLLCFIAAAHLHAQPNIKRVYLANWRSLSVDEQELATLQSAIEQRIRTRYSTEAITFDQARKTLRSSGLEAYETCADISCAVLHGVTLSCSHVIIGKVTQEENCWRTSLALVDIKRRRELSACEREFEGDFQTVLAVGVDEIVSVLWYGKSLAGHKQLIIREIISNPRRERSRFLVGMSAGAAAVAGIAVAVFTMSRKSADDSESQVTDIVVEW